jgi:GNAT superfamily N-acetyltransferase
MEWRIRNSTTTDALQVRQLFARHLEELGYAPDSSLDADFEDFPGRYHLAPNAFAVAVDPRHRVIGMAGLLDNELRRVYVLPACRRLGIARRLILFLLDTARSHGLRALCAIIARDNHPSRRLFGDCGFRATGKTALARGAQHCEIFDLILTSVPVDPSPVFLNNRSALEGPNAPVRSPCLQHHVPPRTK